MIAASRENEYQGFAMLSDEILSRCSPTGQLYIINSLLARLKKTQIKFVHIHQEFGKVKEFRDKLLHIIWVIHQQAPGRVQRMKLSVCDIKSTESNCYKKVSISIWFGERMLILLMTVPATLQFDVQWSERFHANQIVEHTSCVGIMSSIMEFGNGTCFQNAAI